MTFLSEKQKKLLNEFVRFVRDELKIESAPKIQIMNGRKELKTTANYDYTKKDKIIKVNGKGRAIVDIMRSVAHELTHHKQYEQGRLKVKPPDIGGEIEDEANAKAGQLIKKFALKHNNIYDLDEQESTPTPTSTEPLSKSSITFDSPSPQSTSDAAASNGGTTNGYPEVGHWESGVTRGVGNQVATDSKWNSLYNIARGKANKLK